MLVTSSRSALSFSTSLDDAFTPAPSPAATPARARVDVFERPAERPRANPPVITEQIEETILGGRNKPGKLVDIAEGKPNAPLTITIHGIRGTPEDVRPLTINAMERGDRVQTFAYDDNHRRLTDSSRDLATQVEQWMADHPGRPLRFDAHSMGGRIVLGALNDLQERGKLDGRKIELNLVAPPLQGFGAANSARFAIPPFDMIAGVRPGKDMGTSSDFQQMLGSLELPDSVKVNVFTGGKDDVVNSDEEGFTRMTTSLRANVTHFPEGDHMSTVDLAARLLQR